jgi:hypothetical protein
VSVAADLVAAHAPWLPNTELQDYLEVIGEMFSEVELYALDTDDAPGWSILFDPDRCPVKALPYLAQFVGEELPPGLSEALMRERIKDQANQLRGTVWSIFAAAQRNLTGGRLVSIRERDGVGDTDDEDRITVITYTDQTPNPAQTEEDIRSVLDVDLELNYVVASGQSWADVRDTYATWRDLDESGLSWVDIATAQVGVNTFTRPAP